MLQAINDLETIRLFIAKGSESTANREYERIVQAAARLSDFPESGRVVPRLGRRDIREVIVRPYRLLYRLYDDTVEIFTVIHGARRIVDSDLPL